MNEDKIETKMEVAVVEISYIKESLERIENKIGVLPCNERALQLNTIENDIKMIQSSKIKDNGNSKKNGMSMFTKVLVSLISLILTIYVTHFIDEIALRHWNTPTPSTVSDNK